MKASPIANGKHRRKCRCVFVLPPPPPPRVSGRKKGAGQPLVLCEFEKRPRWRTANDNVCLGLQFICSKCMQRVFDWAGQVQGPAAQQIHLFRGIEKIQKSGGLSAATEHNLTCTCKLTSKSAYEAEHISW